VENIKEGIVCAGDTGGEEDGVMFGAAEDGEVCGVPCAEARGCRGCRGEAYGGGVPGMPLYLVEDGVWREFVEEDIEGEELAGLCDAYGVAKGSTGGEGVGADLKSDGGSGDVYGETVP
jgi:hypothetical protein